MSSTTSSSSDMDSIPPTSITLEKELKLFPPSSSYLTKDISNRYKAKKNDIPTNTSFSLPVQNWLLDLKCDNPSLGPCHVTRYDQPVNHRYKNNGQVTQISMSAFHMTEPGLALAVECSKGSNRNQSSCSSRCDSLNSLLPSCTEYSSTRKTPEPQVPNRPSQSTISYLPPIKPKSFPQTKTTSSPYITSKRMLGEHGWLGFSPEETVTMDKGENDKPIRVREKTSVIDKLRSKIGVLAALYTLSNPRACRDGKNKSSLSLTVSLGTREQVNLFMEVDLTIVNTANEFLMKSFSQTLVSIDTIKETVKTWEKKGNKAVSEFLYDQATQRELVVMNQKELRFHGRQARDQDQITVMLSSWEQVIRLMEICCFRTADTVILKMLFDVQYILEFLGATDAVMLRIQEIRNSVVKNMRLKYKPSYDYD